MPRAQDRKQPSTATQSPNLPVSLVPTCRGPTTRLKGSQWPSKPLKPWSTLGRKRRPWRSRDGNWEVLRKSMKLGKAI